MSDPDAKDRKSARTAGIALLVVVLVVVLLVFAGLALLVPALGDFVAVSLTPGVDLKGAALASFIATVVLFVLFALVAGDGLLGELPFMLAGFFAFFLLLMLLVAWIF